MAEFNAHQARKLMDESSFVNLLYWYTEFKYGVFEWIKTAADDGIETIAIDCGLWKHNKHKEKYLIERLTELGYKVDVHGEKLIIKW